MVRHVRLGEFLVGVAGVGLMRHMFKGEDDDAAARLEEIKAIVCGADEVYTLETEVPVVDAQTGYARWSETYDEPGNPLISVEQPVVWAILEDLAPGDALDAACGTGRHALRLHELGHRVVGVDGSPDMLARARAAVAGAEFKLGDLTSLPLGPASFDVVVCALALEHVRELEPAVAELGRVVRAGGRVIISDLHPAVGVLGGAAYFEDSRGERSVVRGYRHLHGDYLRAFEAAGLGVRQCLEPTFGPAEAQMQGPAWSFLPRAAEAAYLGMPGALVWDLVRITPAGASARTAGTRRPPRS